MRCFIDEPFFVATGFPVEKVNLAMMGFQIGQEIVRGKNRWWEDISWC
jgi:hypothetical protein